MGAIPLPPPILRDPVEREKMYWAYKKSALKSQMDSYISRTKLQKYALLLSILFYLVWFIIKDDFTSFGVIIHPVNVSINTFLYFFWKSKMKKFKPEYAKKLLQIKFRIGYE